MEIRSVVIIAVLVGTFSGEWSARAQTPPADAFTVACARELDAIQEDRRICAVGVVENEIEIRVVLSNKSGLIFRKAKIFQSPPQQGQEVPLQGLANKIGQTVAVGGFENGTIIYSARMLSQ